MEKQIFFYGTLKRSILNKEQNFDNIFKTKILEKHLYYKYDTFILKGRMYLIKDKIDQKTYIYPGIILDPQGYPVYGELYSIKNINILDTLDEYEEIEKGLYKRESIIMAGNETYVYIYNQKTDNLQEIKTGRF